METCKQLNQRNLYKWLSCFYRFPWVEGQGGTDWTRARGLGLIGGQRSHAQKIIKKIWGKGAKLIDNIYKDYL